MNLQCPRCEVEIPADAIYIDQGTAHCQSCQQAVDLSQFDLGDEAPVVVEDPGWSRIESFVVADEMGLILPPLGLRGITWFFLMFSVVWNLSSLIGSYQAFKSGNFAGMLFFVPFMAVGVITFCIFLYLLKAELAILMDRETVTLSRTIFGKSFTKVRAFKELRQVEMVLCYKKTVSGFTVLG